MTKEVLQPKIVSKTTQQLQSSYRNNNLTYKNSNLLDDKDIILSFKLNIIGGARRDRTADLLRARQALSQLSYGPRNFLVSDS